MNYDMIKLLMLGLGTIAMFVCSVYFSRKKLGRLSKGIDFSSVNEMDGYYRTLMSFEKLESNEEISRKLEGIKDKTFFLAYLKAVESRVDSNIGIVIFAGLIYSLINLLSNIQQDFDKEKYFIVTGVIFAVFLLIILFKRRNDSQLKARIKYYQSLLEDIIKKQEQ